jgi:hypothetical protein
MLSPYRNGISMGCKLSRIQFWEIWSEGIPDISRSEHNIVVREAKIHNDASVDVSEDGRLLVTLVPSNLPMTTLVGLYSLDKETRGQVLATYRYIQYVRLTYPLPVLSNKTA